MSIKTIIDTLFPGSLGLVRAPPDRSLCGTFGSSPVFLSPLVWAWPSPFSLLSVTSPGGGAAPFVS